MPDSVEPLATSAPFEVEPIGPTIGGEIRGLDLTRPLGAETARQLEAVLIERKVIYLRDQHVSQAQLVSVGRMFGELEVHPFSAQGEHPEVVVLDNHKDNPVLSTDVWHSDTTFRECPTKYSILHCAIVPPVGGDTIWTDMCAAYEGLSERQRAHLDGLKAVHDFRNFRALFGKSEADQERLRRMEELYPNPTHPVVRTHPVTGKKAIYVNPQFTIAIEEMNDDESRLLLDLLFEQVKVPEYQFRLRWRPGTIAFWDNRSTQHYAANDYYPNRRRMERVAVMGDRPF